MIGEHIARQTIERSSGTGEIAVGFGKSMQARAVGQMSPPGIESASGQYFNGSFVSCYLGPCECRIMTVGLGEMRQHSIQPEIREPLQFPSEFHYVAVWNSKPAHARIDLEMIREDPTRGCRSSVQLFGRIQPKDRRRQIMFENLIGLSRPETSKAEDRSADSLTAKADAFFDQGDTEPVGA